MSGEKKEKKRRKWYSSRWLALVVAAILLIFALQIYRTTQFYKSGTGPAGPEVPIEPFEEVWHDGKVVLLGVGDSITNGHTASKGRSYFELLGKNPDNAHPSIAGRELQRVFPGITSLNMARSGTLSQQTLNRDVPALPNYDKDTLGIVCLTTGGNDLIHPYGKKDPVDGALYGATMEQAVEWGKNYRNRLEGIIEGITAKFAGRCEIFLANIYDPTDGVGNIEDYAHPIFFLPPPLPPWKDGHEILALWNRIIAETAEKYDYIHLVDIRSVMLGHGINYKDESSPHYVKDDPYFWYSIILEDPNDRGYDAIRRVFLLKMIEVFAEEKN